MAYLKAEIPYQEDSKYVYATMTANYSRDGDGKNNKTDIEFKDAHGWYGAEVTFTDTAGKTYGPYFAEGLKISIRGEFEAEDFIVFCRRIVKHHDMYNKLVGTS